MKANNKTLFSSVRHYLTEEDVCQTQWLYGLVQDCLMFYVESDAYHHNYELPYREEIERFVKTCLLLNNVDCAHHSSGWMIDLLKFVGIVYHGELCNDVCVISPAYVTLDYDRLMKCRGYMQLFVQDNDKKIISMMDKYVAKCEDKLLEELPF